MGAGQLVLGVELPVQVRELDGVGDGLDLVVEPTDVGVGDVGHLLEDQLLDLGPGQLLDQQAGARLHQDGVAGPELDADQGVGQLGHPLLVGPAEDQGPPAVLEHLLQHHHLAGALALAGQDHVERLVEHDLVAPLEVVGLDVGVERHPHLAAAGEDVDRAVVVGPEEGPVGRRRLGQLLDLLAQVGHVLLGRLQGEGQLLVLGDGLGQLALGLEQLLLEGLDPRGLSCRRRRRTVTSSSAAWARILNASRSSSVRSARRWSSAPSSKSTVGITSLELHPCWRPYTGAYGFHARIPATGRADRHPRTDLTDRQSTGPPLRIALGRRCRYSGPRRADARPGPRRSAAAADRRSRPGPTSRSVGVT